MQIELLPPICIFLVHVPLPTFGDASLPATIGSSILSADGSFYRWQTRPAYAIRPALVPAGPPLDSEL